MSFRSNPLSTFTLSDDLFLFSTTNDDFDNFLSTGDSHDGHDGVSGSSKLSNIISFSGRKSSGKSAIASELQKVGYHILNIADALKDLIRKLLFISNDTLEEYKNNPNQYFTLDNFQIYLLSTKLNIHHETIQNVLGIQQQFNIRQLLQLIGTELIRNFNPDWHLEKLQESISLLQSENQECKICIPDVRFINELAFIKNILKGSCYYIIRPHLEESTISNHISETQLNWTFFDDSIIINNCSLHMLINKLIDIHTSDGSDRCNLQFFKSQMFLHVNCKTAYLAGKLFLNTKLKHSLTPFINENYKLWYPSNKRYPDILENIKNNKIKNIYIRAWLKGMFDFLSRKR